MRRAMTGRNVRAVWELAGFEREAGAARREWLQHVARARAYGRRGDGAKKKSPPTKPCENE